MLTGYKVRIPKLDRHKTGQARVRIRGRSFYLGKFGTDEANEAYRRLIAQYVVSGEIPSVSEETGTVTVAELLLAFWKQNISSGIAYHKNGKPTSEVSLFKSAIAAVRELYGTTPVADFSPKCLKLVRELMVRPKKQGGRGWRRQTVNSQVRRIKQIFRWGVEHEMVPPAVFQALEAVAGLKKGRTTARDQRQVEPVELRRVVAAMRQLPPVIQDMVRFQLRTGCRPGEVCQLRPCDIDQTKEPWVFVPESHKTEHHGSERRIFIGPKTQRVLAKYLKNREASAYCFSPKEANAQRLRQRHARRKTPLSCGNRPGTNRRKKLQITVRDQWDSQTYGRAIRRACKQANIKPWSPNQLRHTAATMIRRQFGVEAAQVVLGHKNVRVTEVYAERDYAKARQIAATIG